VLGDLVERHPESRLRAGGGRDAQAGAMASAELARMVTASAISTGTPAVRAILPDCASKSVDPGRDGIA
jgi:hypothetical protein